MKSTTVKLIKELLDSVPIEINYKNDIFLEETNNFNQYATKNMPKYKLMNDGKLDPVYAAARKAKNNISFNEVKRDIINHKGKDRLHKLEDLYIDMYSDNAIACEDDLDDFFFDEIADALNDFLDEIGKLMKKKSLKPIYIAKAKGKSRGLCLVYTNGVQPPYQYATLDNLLDKVAKAAICYCNNATNYSILSNLPDKKGKTDKDTPMYIRRVCAIICYVILRFGNYVSIKNNKTQLPSHSGVCSQIMTDLHNRCINLGYPYFTKEDKLFQYDKWSISPETMLRTRSYVPPKMPMAYAGMKEGYLGFLISELQKQVAYKRFLDAFGGSGASSVQFKHNDDAEYYINDFNYCIVSYYRVMQTDDQAVYNEFIDKIYLLNSLYIDAFNTAILYRDKLIEGGMNYTNARKMAAIEFYQFSDPIYDFFDSITDYQLAQNYLNTPLNACTNLVNGIKSFTGNDIIQFMRPYKISNIRSYGSKNFSYIDAAVLFAYYAAHPISGSIKKKIFSNKVIYKGNNYTRDDFVKFYASLKDEFNSTVVNLNGDSAMRLLADPKFNQSDTLAYLDSPYIGTAGYTVNKTVKNSLRPKDITNENIGAAFHSTEFDMDALIQSCSNFEGKYIFSCRMNMVYKDVNERLKKDKISTRSGVRFILNNYIWFWKQWQKTDDYVLFMYDKDFVADKVVESRVNGVQWSFEEDENIIKYLYYHAFKGIDLEVMIVNFDFTTPDFENIYEFGDIGNIHKKQTDPFKKVPKNGAFIKMPVKHMAEIILTAIQIYVDNL